MVEDIRRNARRGGNDSGLCLGRPAYQNGYVELERQKKTFASRLLFYVFHPPCCPPMLTVNINLIKEERFVTNFSYSYPGILSSKRNLALVYRLTTVFMGLTVSVQTAKRL